MADDDTFKATSTFNHSYCDKQVLRDYLEGKLKMEDSQFRIRSTTKKHLELMLIPDDPSFYEKHHGTIYKLFDEARAKNKKNTGNELPNEN